MLEFRQVTAGYSQGFALADISLRFAPGVVTAVGGMNGSGKSTLLKLACGLLEPKEGEIRLDGKLLSDFSSQERARHLAYLPQGRNVPELTAFKMVLHGRFPYLDFPRRYRAEDLEMAEEALRWVGSADLADRSMASLSGGQRQKVYIAMALAQDTDVVLMDEPTTYLDIKARFEVMELALRLAEMGKTILIVLHDLDLMLRYAGRVVLLEKGRLAADGPPSVLCEDGSVSRVFGVAVGLAREADGDHYYFRNLPRP